MTDLHDECGCTEYRELSRRGFVTAGLEHGRARAPRECPGLAPRRALGAVGQQLARRHRLDLHARRCRRTVAGGAVWRRRVLHGAPEHRDPPPRCHVAAARHRARQLLHAPAGDGGAAPGLPGQPTAHRARDGAVGDQLALALRGRALSRGRKAGRLRNRHRVACAAPDDLGPGQAHRAAARDLVRVGRAHGSR